MTIPHYPTPLLRPTDSQIIALGHLMIVYRVYVLPGISFEDIEELVTMRLCHANRSNSGLLCLRWDISSRLLREWAPYQRIADEWHKAFSLLHESVTVPARIIERNSKFLPPPLSTSATVDFMRLLVLECGRGLASNWMRWKREDQRE